MTGDALTVGAWVRQRRRTLGLTQAELAARVPCATITIRKIEAGDRRPSRETAACLAEALELDPDGVDEFVAAARTWLAPRDPGLEPVGSVRPRHALPHPTTALVGREEVLTDLLAVLAPGGGPARLLTLTGPPGVGKTRLAVELGALTERKFDLEAVWVDLAGIDEPRDVLPTVAAAVAPPAVTGGSMLDLVVHTLDRRPHLLVLDNFEQVVGAGPDVSGLLAAVGELTVIVTSRLPLDVSGEHEHRVEPLPVRRDDRLGPAVDLFLARAREVAPDRDLTDLDEVAAVCGLVDGLPLAIELAALRLRDLDLPGLRAAFDDGLGVLGDNRRDRPARHRTIHDAIASSVGRLTPEESQVLQGVAVLAGPVDDELVAAVVDLDLDRVRQRIRGLQYQGLLPRGDGRERRCLAVVQEHVLEGLDDDLEAHLRRRHALAVTARAEAISSGINAWPERAQIEAMAELDDDIRTALAYWDGPAADAEQLVALVLAVGPIWYVSGRPEDYLRWSTRAHERAPNDHRAIYLWATGRWGLGEQDPELVDLLARAARLAAGREDHAWEAECVGTQQLVHLSRGELEPAMALQGPAEVAADRAGPEWQGLAALRGGDLALLRGDLDEAARLVARATRVYDGAGGTWGQATLLGLSGDFAAAEGRFPDAARAYTAAVTRFLDGALVGSAIGRVTSTANLLVRAGHPREAAAVYGLVDQWLDDLGAPLEPMAVFPMARWRPVAAAAVGTDWDAAVARGRDLPRTSTTLVELTDRLLAP